MTQRKLWMLPAELYTVDLEREIIRALGQRAYTTIYCSTRAGGCGDFSKEAAFGQGERCPSCGQSLSTSTPQGRNAPLTAMLEPHVENLLKKVIEDSELLRGSYYVKPNVICEELELTRGSQADLAILSRPVVGAVSAQDIRCVIEIKMSLLWNWEPGNANPIADYDQHKGRPSIGRTDSILKAAGKAAILRGTTAGRSVPYVVIANLPPPPGYYGKIDATVQGGFIQRWLSITPNPTYVDPSESRGSRERNPKRTPNGGFLRLDSISELTSMIEWILTTDWHFLAGTYDPEALGQLISSLPSDVSLREIGEVFLERLAALTPGGTSDQEEIL